MRKVLPVIAIMVSVFALCAPKTDDGTTSTTTTTLSPMEPLGTNVNIIYLHHSTGACVWAGGVQEWIDAYNASNGVSYNIVERAYPESSPYGWSNYPYDYWNIWVNHAGMSQYMSEDTLELFAASNYQVILWKHCYPVSEMNEDSATPDISSPYQCMTNYVLQYEALKTKMHEFPNIRFIVWTGAVKLETDLSAESAARMQTFVNWVKNDWDEKGDNIFVWDFYTLETGGGMYLDPANNDTDDPNHPNETFSAKVAPLIAQRIVDVIEGRGDIGSITGE